MQEESGRLFTCYLCIAGKQNHLSWCYVIVSREIDDSNLQGLREKGPRLCVGGECGCHSIDTHCFSSPRRGLLAPLENHQNKRLPCRLIANQKGLSVNLGEFFRKVMKPVGNHTNDVCVCLHCGWVNLSILSILIRKLYLQLSLAVQSCF